MDDDRNKSLDYQEFRKGIQDYGLDLEDEVSIGACHCVNVDLRPEEVGHEV